MGKQPDEDHLDEGKSDESSDAEEHPADDQSDEKENNRGEGHGNLKRRSDWFQKQHGGG
jgi:hypothetical protein